MLDISLGISYDSLQNVHRTLTNGSDVPILLMKKQRFRGV
jgi:hypothetical protein